MIHMIGDWLATIRALGESFLDVLQAEWVAFKGDLQESGRLLSRGVKLIVVILFLAFWLIGLLLFALVSFLAQTLGLWVAALIVAGGLLLVTLILGLWTRATLRRVRGPGDTAKTHMREHVDWIKGELAMTEDASGGIDEHS